MSDVRLKIELGFESFGRLVYRHRWVAIILTLLLVAGMASGLPKLRFDTSTESFLHPDDPTLLTYNDFRRQFGRDELLVVAIKSDKLFTLEILEKFKALHKEIEDKTPHVDDVTSMVNARNTRGEGDRLIVEDLLENWPETDADLAGLRRRVLANPLYLNRMISADGTFTTIVVKTDTYTNRGESAGLEDALEGFDDSAAGEGFDSLEPPFLTDEENSEMVNKVREIVARHEADDFKIYLAGSPVITDSIKRSMLHDARTFVKYVILTIGLCLLLMFRRPTGVILPLLTVALAVVSTMGLMARLGVAVTLPTNILPSFILAVGVGASVHVLALFYRHLDRSGDREESIVLALGHSGLAIVLTTMITAAGLASFATASVAPIAHLGIFAAAGVVFALIFTIVLLPAFLAILPARPKAHSYKEKNGIINRFLGWAADFSTGRPLSITAVAAAVITLSIVGMTRLEFSHDPLKWLPATMTKLDYYFGPWDLSAILVHEVRFNKNPAFGSDFFPADRPLPPEDKPDWDAAAEYGLALQGIFSGWDLSLFYARFYDDAPHPVVAAPPTLPFLPPTLKLTHSRLTMYGGSANVASGAWLFKAEAALFDGLEFFNLPGVKKSRLDLLAGVEYSGFKDTTVALELANRQILNYDPRLSALPDNMGEDEFQSAFRITRLFLHDRLEVNFLASTLGLTGENGAIHRLTFKYDFTDHWSATTGLLLYESGTKPAANDLNKNDRVFVEVEYKF